MRLTSLNIPQMIGQALISIQSLLTIALFIALFFGIGAFRFFGVSFPASTWIVLGVFVELIIIQQTVGRMIHQAIYYGDYFERMIDLTQLETARLRTTLGRVLALRSDVVAIYDTKTQYRFKIRQALDEINSQILHIQNLALHIESLDAQRQVNTDIAPIPPEIERIQQQLQAETDPQVIATLEDQLRHLLSHQDYATQLEWSTKNAYKRIKAHVVAVEEIHAEMMTL